MSTIKVIAGLGNPGPSYQATRHNAGAWFIEQIARAYNIELQSNRQAPVFSGEVTVEGERCYLIIPKSYMNLSGQPIQQFMHFYKLSPSDLLVAHDELDIPVGDLRLKQGGGHGGHNGLRSIVQQLGSSEFKRLRIGIAHPGHADKVADYVLQKPSLADKQLIDDKIDEAVCRLPLIIKSFSQAMNLLHAPKS